MEKLLKIRDLEIRWDKGERFVRNRTSKLWTTRHGTPRLSFVRLGNVLRFREADVLAYEKACVKAISPSEAAKS
jgi:hypothetical protein